MDNIVQYLIAALVGMTGLFLFQRSKTNTAEALNKNIDEKNKVNQITQQETPDKVNVAQQQANQQQINQDLQKEKDTNVDLKELSDFLNKPHDS
jgi:hypothetical protein